MRILYIGSLDETSNSFRRFITLRLMGYEVNGINVDNSIYKGPFIKLHHHLNLGPGIAVLNRKVIESTTSFQPDLIWLDNKSFLKTSVIKKIKAQNPGVKIVNIVTDDITGRLKYQWRLALRNAKLFDCFFVQREVNVEELKRYGANKVELCYRSYDPDFHRRFALDPGDETRYRSAVGFIGTYESYREEYIAFLIQNNIPVAVTGDGWENKKFWHLIRPFYKGRSVYGLPYVKTINGTAIVLHFLRRSNRDEQDSRTFEIPACGGFMLAEKSHLHTQLFQAGKEAVFFESKQELLEKVNYFLEHKEKRAAIAEAGSARCSKSGYSHEGRLSAVIETVRNL